VLEHCILQNQKKTRFTYDIDLMIIGDPDISYLNEKIAELEKRLKREINITAHSSEEYKAKKKAPTGCGKIGREALCDESYARARRSTI
jgi:predicted nucleotidyltransferase